MVEQPLTDWKTDGESPAQRESEEVECNPKERDDQLKPEDRRTHNVAVCFAEKQTRMLYYSQVTPCSRPTVLPCSEEVRYLWRVLRGAPSTDELPR